MIRLTALNDDNSKILEEYDTHPKEPPEEVQEENALKVYNEALAEQKSGNLVKAQELYKQLLHSPLLMKVKPDEEFKQIKPDSIASIYSKPTLMLKYSCLKNLALISNKKNLFSDALEYYLQAVDVEGTDVTMWYQIGCLALKVFNLSLALEAFSKALEFRPKHWPSIDKLIICLFVLNDYINCLHFISKAFEWDVNYTRGQVLRDHIFKEQPSLEFDIKCFFTKIDLHVNLKNGEKKEVKEKLLNEVLNLRKEYINHRKTDVVEEEIKIYTPKKSMKNTTWTDLGEYILQIHEELTNQEIYISLLTPINLKKPSLPNTENAHNSNFNSCEVKDTEEESKTTKDAEEESVKEKSDSGGDKKTKKNRGSALMEELLWGGKRRSARVRSSLRGNPEPMDVAEALRRILPRRLLHKTKQPKAESSTKISVPEEDSMDTMDLYKLFEKQESAEEKRLKEELEKSEAEQDTDKIVSSEGYFGTEKESEDVLAFISDENNKGIIDIIKPLVMRMETLWKKTWPNCLRSVYIKCYQLMKKFYTPDFEMCSTASSFKELVKESGSVLLYGELYVELVASRKNEAKSENKLDIMFLQNLMELSDRREMFDSEEQYFEFLVRLYWLRCRIFLEKGQTSLAIVALNDVLACFELFPQFQSNVINLRNCRKHNIISQSVAEQFLAFQSRKKSLAEVVRLYEDESYKELTEILKESFTSTPDFVSGTLKDQESELIDRQTQLSMLINGFYNLNEYKECIYWLETCCYEILQKSSNQSEDEECWMITFDRFLIAIQDCLKLGKTTITNTLPPNKVSRFVQTLCHAICKELEDSDRPPCPARPWIMLNTILVGLEEEKKSEPEVFDNEEDENDIPFSVLILFTAHEYLGRREWCNCNESILLFLIMDQIIPHIRKPAWASFRETVQQYLEQVVYCLYAHPNKKIKSRYLTDHNVNSITLTWERGVQLFDLFRPDEIPAYDSLKVNLINSDTELLFRKIAELIPDEKDPAQLSDELTDFIVGKRNDLPETIIRLPERAKDLFYILGDYYFKTHEFAKAVKYLLIDLCANPERVDSWASMALSKASILEQQLNSCNPLKEGEFLQEALSALRCYEHCLQLDNKQCTLWIEYGSFVYTIHSFCSQRMKLESDSLSLEQFEELESTKNKMLDTAKEAFTNANLIWYDMKEETERQDERWLHHYMLGKISEKNGDLNYFDHYEKAAELLYENQAEFPSKVGYSSPQTLAIEALEVYYRIHVCVIKCLELNEGKSLDVKTRQLFNKHLNACSKGAFAKQMSKGDLAKLKAKEIETAQNEKNMKIIKSVLNDIISKVESESDAENCKVPTIKSESMEQDEGITIIDSPTKVEVVEDNKDIINVDEKKERFANEGECLGNGSEEKLKNQTEGDSQYLQRNVLELAKLAEGSFEQGQPTVSGNLSFSDQQTPSDNYFVTLEDFKNLPQSQTKSKKKRRASRPSVSSSSGDSEDIRYDDDSSSSSTSSESSASSQSSSSSSSETSQSDETNKETKVTDEDEKEKESKSDSSERKETADEQIDDSENNMLKKCLSAFETCALRFPQHYKSVYRLAHFYFRSKQHRDINKCRDLLLGQYHTPNGIISGLFAERKNTNFFNGIWRIPAGDVDRPGSFASHMSRSVLLLMEVLRDSKDHKMLLEICLQLRRKPEPDKKYLREEERNQLSVQAFNLTTQTLKKTVKESEVMTLPIVLDCYHCYQKVHKYYPQKEAVFVDILLEAFRKLGKGDKCSLELATKFCQSELSASKNKMPKSLVAGQSSQSAPSKPKPPKMKKQEKKKSTPKPQITAKAIQKTPKPRKPYETKKRMFMKALATGFVPESNFWPSPTNIPSESSQNKSADFGKTVSSMTNSQMYTELLRTAAFSAKQKEQIDKKVADHMALNNIFDAMKPGAGQTFIPDPSKANMGFFPFTNYPVDYNNEMYKQLISKMWFNSSFTGNLFNQAERVGNAKSKTEYKGPTRSVLKPKIKKPETPKPEEPKAKTNFNIENILRKPTNSQASSASKSLGPFLSKDVEEKIKSISGEVNITKLSSSQAINLSTHRKNVSEAPKRPLAESTELATIKKICRAPEPSKANKKEDVEVVVIDD